MELVFPYPILFLFSAIWHSTIVKSSLLERRTIESIDNLNTALRKIKASLDPHGLNGCRLIEMNVKNNHGRTKSEAITFQIP